MEITSVKIQTEGWLLNGTMSVPNAQGNMERELIMEWLKTNAPEPEFTEAELLANAKEKAISEALTYLQSTDFYMTVDKYNTLTEERKIELTTKRAEARTIINGGI